MMKMQHLPIIKNWCEERNLVTLHLEEHSVRSRFNKDELKTKDMINKKNNKGINGKYTSRKLLWICKI